MSVVREASDVLRETADLVSEFDPQLGERLVNLANGAEVVVTQAQAFGEKASRVLAKSQKVIASGRGLWERVRTQVEFVPEELDL